MNKRILKLFNEAGFHQPEMERLGIEDKFERFAELIVRECIDKGSVLANHYIDTHTEQEQVMLLAAVSDYSREIKKHFGVKE